MTDNKWYANMQVRRAIRTEPMAADNASFLVCELFRAFYFLRVTSLFARYVGEEERDAGAVEWRWRALRCHRALYSQRARDGKTPSVHGV
jgi:hypothetical protein